MKLTKDLRAGFSILELAIVLTVIALIVSSSLAVAATRIGAAKVENTLNGGETLVEIIEAYTRNFGHLPCPADPQATPASDDFGVGKTDGSGNCIAANLISSGNALIGSVPTATLGLSPSSGADGWTRRFTYVVDNNLVTSAGYTAANGSLTILPAAGVAATPDNSQAMFVLISHGSNGHGAWRAKGGATRIEADETPSDDELENADGDAVFVQKMGSETFDDFVQYKLKWQLTAGCN